VIGPSTHKEEGATRPRAQRRPSRTELLAQFFRRRPNVWIDGRQLANVAGAYAWRTRLSDLRRPPYSMAVENVVRRAELEPGRKFAVSEYRYVPDRTDASPNVERGRGTG
jgi:hypothetical protein